MPRYEVHVYWNCTRSGVEAGPTGFDSSTVVLAPVRKGEPDFFSWIANAFGRSRAQRIVNIFPECGLFSPNVRL